MKIYLVRHGEAAHNASFNIRQSESAYMDPAHRDAPLTSHGRIQVQNLADRVAAEVPQWDQVFTSPLTRCLQTAEILLDKIPGQAPQVTDLLIERRGGGHICNQRKSVEILQACQPTQEFVLSEDRDWTQGPKETDAVLEARMDFLMKIVTVLHGENILVVSHHDLIESQIGESLPNAGVQVINRS